MKIQKKNRAQLQSSRTNIKQNEKIENWTWIIAMVIIVALVHASLVVCTCRVIGRWPCTVWVGQTLSGHAVWLSQLRQSCRCEHMSSFCVKDVWRSRSHSFVEVILLISTASYLVRKAFRDPRSGVGQLFELVRRTEVCQPCCDRFICNVVVAVAMTAAVQWWLPLNFPSTDQDLPS